MWEANVTNGEWWTSERGRMNECTKLSCAEDTFLKKKKKENICISFVFSIILHFSLSLFCDCQKLAWPCLFRAVSQALQVSLLRLSLILPPTTISVNHVNSTLSKRWPLYGWCLGCFLCFSMVQNYLKVITVIFLLLQQLLWYIFNLYNCTVVLVNYWWYEKKCLFCWKKHVW